MNRKPTIRTLAKLAGVSYSTVSLALRNHPRIRVEVRERIQRLAAEAGYKSDPIVSELLARLRSNRKTTYQSSLAFICIDENPARLMEIATFHELFVGSKERASDLGYNIESFLLSPNGGLSPKRLSTILRARNIRGVLLVDTLKSTVFLKEFDGIWRNSASVALGVRPTYPPINFALNDHFTTAARAVEEAFKLGYRRPALYIPQQVEDWVESRFSGGFQVGLAKAGVRQQASSFKFESNREELFDSWIRKEKPDVILTLDRGIREWLAALDLKVPQDIGIIQLDSHGEPAWAGMQQNIQHVARMAVDLLIGQLHRNEFGVPEFQSGVTVASTWVEGPSVRDQRLTVKI